MTTSETIDSNVSTGLEKHLAFKGTFGGLEVEAVTLGVVNSMKRFYPGVPDWLAQAIRDGLVRERSGHTYTVEGSFEILEPDDFLVWCPQARTLAVSKGGHDIFLK